MTTEPWNIPLAHILYQRRWQACQEPFPHMVAYEVFRPEFYSWLESAYGNLLALGLSEKHAKGRFSRNVSGYDVYSVNLTSDTPPPFNVFLSKAWHDMLANLVGIRTTGDVNAGFHHHAPGSKSGQVHNDLNPGWFIDPPDTSQVNLAQNELCAYATGKTGYDNLRVHQTIRAIAVLFYLHNPPWTGVEGGETGLYSNQTQSVDEPVKTVPPINNSLFLFECRPNSYHSFLSNRTVARNSIIMWLHRPVEDVVQRWGEKSIMHWKNGPKNSTS
jgi:hypothetical protein